MTECKRIGVISETISFTLHISPNVRLEEYLQQIAVFITSLQISWITFTWSPNDPTIWSYQVDSKTRPSFSAHLYWSFSSTYPWRIPGDKLRELRQNHGENERSWFVFPEDDDSMIVIVLKSETISKIQFQLVFGRIESATRYFFLNGFPNAINLKNIFGCFF